MRLDEFDRPSFDSQVLARLRDSEDSFVERKESVQTTKIRRTAVAFANSLPSGREGVIFVGVRDSGEPLPPGQFQVKPAEEKARNALGECYPKIPRVTYRSLRIGESEVLAIVIPASPKRPLRANMRETVYPSEIREQGEEAKGLWTLHAGWMEDKRPWESRSEGAASEARRPAAEGLPRSSARRCPLGRSLRLTPR